MISSARIAKLEADKAAIITLLATFGAKTGKDTRVLSAEEKEFLMSTYRVGGVTNSDQDGSLPVNSPTTRSKSGFDIN